MNPGCWLYGLTEPLVAQLNALESRACLGASFPPAHSSTSARPADWIESREVQQDQRAGAV